MCDVVFIKRVLGIFGNPNPSRPDVLPTRTDPNRPDVFPTRPDLGFSHILNDNRFNIYPPDLYKAKEISLLLCEYKHYVKGELKLVEVADELNNRSNK